MMCVKAFDYKYYILAFINAAKYTVVADNSLQNNENIGLISN